MPVVLAVAAGGSLGALARFGLDSLIEHRADSLFPWATFTINVTGCFLNGLVVAIVVDAFHAPSWLSRGLVIGFLGAYTTFSTLSLDTFRLLERGELGQAVANMAGTVVLGMLAVWAGITVGRL